MDHDQSSRTAQRQWTQWVPSAGPVIAGGLILISSLVGGLAVAYMVFHILVESGIGVSLGIRLSGLLSFGVGGFAGFVLATQLIIASPYLSDDDAEQ